MAMTIDELVIADPPELWAELGFRIEDDACHIGTVRVCLDSRAGKRVASWSLRGADTDDLDGLTTTTSSSAERQPAEAHPNGVVAIDHVVAFSPDLDRTVEKLQAAGLGLRRIREEPTPAGAPRQAFFRLGEVILECVQLPDSPDLDRSRSACLWGLALRTGDLDATAEFLGDRLGVPRPAVQEGRMIATLERDAGSSVPMAFMSPAPVPAA
jgi:catechol 2,3-dioxygenase-like lactoylglutathione lyase family enzyme